MDDYDKSQRLTSKNIRLSRNGFFVSSASCFATAFASKATSLTLAVSLALAAGSNSALSQGVPRYVYQDPYEEMRPDDMESFCATWPIQREIMIETDISKLTKSLDYQRQAIELMRDALDDAKFDQVGQKIVQASHAILLGFDLSFSLVKNLLADARGIKSTIDSLKRRAYTELLPDPTPDNFERFSQDFNATMDAINGKMEKVNKMSASAANPKAAVALHLIAEYDWIPIFSAIAQTSVKLIEEGQYLKSETEWRYQMADMVKEFEGKLGQMETNYQRATQDLEDKSTYVNWIDGECDAVKSDELETATPLAIKPDRTKRLNLVRN